MCKILELEIRSVIFWGWKPLTLEGQRGLHGHMETPYATTCLVVTQTLTVTLKCVNHIVCEQYLNCKK